MSNDDSAAAEILRDDCASAIEAVGDRLTRLGGRRLLITGGAGFLGSWLLHWVVLLNRTLLAGSPCKVVCLDILRRGVPRWLEGVFGRSEVELLATDLTRLTAAELPPFDFAIHAASIASPPSYRRHRLETMEATVHGVKLLLQAASESTAGVESVLVLSSSEIYGQPPPDKIPTPESYLGNVSCTGPRACYDEAKRYAETLCVNYHRVHGVPVKIARPFNNYGPCLPLNDGRGVADMIASALEKRDIEIFSDGSPTRTFCYAADAIAGYLSLLLSDHNADPFNIGAAGPEVSVLELARLMVQLAKDEMGTAIDIKFRTHEDGAYLTDNPQRRCPDVTKAREVLGFSARFGLELGLCRSLKWYALQDGRP